MFNPKRNGARAVIAYAPFVVWAGVILFLGSDPGSAQQTSRFLRPLIEFFFPGLSPEGFAAAHSIVRKSAHVIEYAILAALAWWAFRNRYPDRRLLQFTLAMLTVLLIAGIDEFHQSYEPGRTASANDVLLDCLGGLFALAIIFLVTTARGRENASRLERRSD